MVTINMLTEYLNYPVISAPEDRHMHFDAIYPLDVFDFSCLPLTGGLSPHNIRPLFLGTVEQAAAFLEERPDAFVMALMRTGESIASLMKNSDKAIICSTDEAVHSCFTRASAIFMIIDSWQKTLNKLILENRSYQDFVKCSEAILGNFVTITDSEFKLVAHSTQTTIDDEETSYLIEHGQHSTATIENFRKYNLMPLWNEQEGIELKPSSVLNKYPTLDYVFRMDGNYSLHLNLHCNHTPPTPGLNDTLQILIDSMEHCVDKHWEDSLPGRQEVAALFEQLLQSSNGFLSVATKALAVSLGVPETSEFVLFAWLFSENPSERFYDPYHIRFLQDTFPDCLIAEHDEYILMLDLNNSVLTDGKGALEEFLKQHECTVGVSCSFFSLGDFNLAFQQAALAVLLTKKPDMNMSQLFNAEYDNQIQKFDDHLLEYVVKTARENDPLIAFSAQNSIVAQVAKFDKEHGIEDLKILYHYLASNCKASVACETLFMHRSTLLYRINKMQERFGFDLNDYTTRLKITLGFLIILQEDSSVTESL